METKLECSLKGRELKCPYCKADFDVDYTNDERIYSCHYCREPIKVEASISFALIPPTAREVLAKMAREVDAKKSMNKKEIMNMIYEFAGEKVGKKPEPVKEEEKK